MTKKRWIILIIVTILIWVWTTYFICIRQTWKIETKSECQDFIDECYKKNFEFYAWGWQMFEVYPDWSTSLDDKANCPQDCSRYTEKRWYFNDKERQQEYYNEQVTKCKKEYNECMRKPNKRFWECHECDEYWQPRYQWN